VAPRLHALGGIASDLRPLLDAVAFEIAKDGGYNTIEEAYEQAAFYLRSEELER
jgi:hypothetical protein